VPLTLAILLESVLYRNLLGEDILAMNVGHSSVTALKVAETDESKTLARTIVISRNLGHAQKRAKAAEGIVKDLLVHRGIEITDEELGTDICGLLLVCGGLVDAQGLSVELDTVDHVGSILGVGRCTELDEAETLV
jgi:hypothetical protein